MFVNSVLIAVTTFLFLSNTYGYVLYSVDEDFDVHPSDQGIKKTMLNENRLPKVWSNDVTGFNVQMVRSNISREHGNACEECKTVVKEIADTLNDEKAVARYKRALKMICMMATQKVVECQAFLEGVDTVLESLKDYMNDPDRVCHQLHVCGDARPNVASRILLLGLKSFNFEMQASQKGIDGVDILCDECVFMANELAAILSDPAYQNSIQDVIKKLCEVIPQVKGECESTIDAYAPSVFQEILEYLANPKPFCQKIGFCKSFEQDWYPLTPLMPANMDLAPQENKPCMFSTINANGKPNSCLVCDFLANTLLNQLKEDSQMNSVEEAVMSMCFSLPSEWAYSCVDWVSAYLKPSLMSLLNDIHPRTICATIHACGAADRFKILAMSPAEQREVACEACKAITVMTKAELKSRQYQKAVRQFLTNLCNKAPLHVAEKCHLTTEMYVKKMNTLMYELDQPDRLCSNLGVCSSERILWT